MRKLLVAKAILSTMLIIVFLILASTGALLYFGQTGVILGFSRHALREAHFWIAVIMCVMIPIHLFLNRWLYKSELKAIVRNPKGSNQNEKESSR